MKALTWLHRVLITTTTLIALAVAMGGATSYGG